MILDKVTNRMDSASEVVMIDIATGLSATKTGLELIKGVRELLKRSKVDPTEVSQRLNELQEALYHAREALADAQDENRKLAQQIGEDKKLSDISCDMEFVEDGGFYVRRSEKTAGKNIPYCPLCWTKDKTATPLNPQSGDGLYRCDEHKSRYETAAHAEQRKQKTALSLDALGRSYSAWS